MILSLLVIIVSAFIVYEAVKGRSRLSLVVLALANIAAAIWYVLS